MHKPDQISSCFGQTCASYIIIDGSPRKVDRSGILIGLAGSPVNP